MRSALLCVLTRAPVTLKAQPQDQPRMNINASTCRYMRIDMFSSSSSSSKFSTYRVLTYPNLPRRQKKEEGRHELEVEGGGKSPAHYRSSRSCESRVRVLHTHCSPNSNW